MFQCVQTICKERKFVAYKFFRQIWAKYPVSRIPTKDWRGKSCWLNQPESGPEVLRVPGGVTTSPTLLDPVLVWSQQKYVKLLLTVRYSKSS